MDLRSLELPNLDIPITEVAYDAADRSLLLANSSGLANYELSSRNITSQSHWGLPDLPVPESVSKEEQNTKPKNALALRFSPASAQSKLLISPSGLIVTCVVVTEELAVTDVGFDSGVHYWEIICPKHCKNVHVGVIREGWNLSNPASNANLLQVHSFKTSTPRVIGLRLDLNKGELYFWLNGNPQPHRTLKNLPPAVWHPCVKLKESGTHVILNPFVTDPDAIYPIYDPKTKLSLSQIKCALPQLVVVSGIQKPEKENIKFEEIFTFVNEKDSFAPIEKRLDETGTMVAFRFKTAAEAEAFKLANQGKKSGAENIHILDNSLLLSALLESHKTDKDISSIVGDKGNQYHLKKMVLWIKRIAFELFKHYEYEHNEGVEQLDQLCKNVIQKITSSKGKAGNSTAPLKEFNLKYIAKSESLLVTQGNLLKLFSKKDGKFHVNSGAFTNKPKNPRDEIYLTLSRQSIAIILSELNLKENGPKLASKSRLIAFREFLLALDRGLEQDSTAQEVNIQIRYKYAKNFVNELLDALIYSLKWLQTLVKDTINILQNKKIDSKSIQADPYTEENELCGFDVENENLVVPEEKLKETEQKNKYLIMFKHLTVEQIYFMLQILLSIDETLYAMTLHDQASPKLQKYWPSKQPRLFTAFGRLGSLLTFPSNKYSLIQLAEAGLYNTQDFLYDMRHFLDPDKRIEEIHNIKEDQELWSLLQKSLPNNRMIQGFPSENVPLHVTLNNIPAQNHSYDPRHKIIEVATNEKTTLVSTVSDNGEVKVWNTELALICMASSNFRQNAGVEKASLNKKEEYEENFLAGIDLDEFKNEPQVVPDTEMVDTLYNMGFPVELAKKALVLTKNAGIAGAVEKILALQEEQKTDAPKTTTTTTTTVAKAPATLVKPKWDCPACTFVNTNQNKLCEICGCQAPPDAYYTEDEQPKVEKKKAPEPQQKFTDIAKICNHVIIPLENSPLSPVVVGVMFEEQSEQPTRYQLRLRRFMHNANYIKRFLKMDQAKGHSSLISGAWFNQDLKAASDHLTNEYGLTFRALEPIYMGNLRYGDLRKEGKHNLFCGDLIYLVEQDFNIETAPGRLIGMTTVALPREGNSNRDNTSVLLLWADGSKHVIQQINVSAGFFDPLAPTEDVNNQLKVEEILKVDLDISGKVLDFQVCGENLLIVTTDQILTYNPLKLESPKNVQSLSTKPNKARLLSSQAVSIVTENNRVHIIELDKGIVPDDSSSHIQAQHGGKTDNLDLNELHEGKLDSIRAVLHKKPLEGVLNQSDYVTQSGYQYQNRKYTRFFLPLDHNQLNGSTLEVAFLQPTSLINLELSLSFATSGKNKVTTLEGQKEFIKHLWDKYATNENKAEGAVVQKEEVGQEVQTKEAKLPILTITESDSGSKFLPLTVYSFKGAAFNESFPVSKLISPNNEVFSTNYPNSEFVFEHLHGKTMLVKSVTVHSKFKPIGSCGFPIGSGLIFTSNHLSHFDMTSRFHSFKHEEFLEWFKARSQEGREFEPWEPVGSFQFDAQSEAVTVDILFVRPCKYILLKPTSMRSKPENYSHLFAGSPLEIKFFGASGAVVNETAIETRTQPSKPIDVATGSEVVLEAQTQEGEWITIQTLRDIQLNYILGKDNFSVFNSIENKESLSEIPLWGTSLLEISNEVLFQKKIKKLRARVTARGGRGHTNWSVTGVGIQAFASSQLDEINNLPFSPATLRKILLNGQEFDKFNKVLIQEISKEGISQQKRKKITTLISEIISTEPSLTDLFYHHFDLKSFILYSVLREKNSTFLEIQHLLRHFSSQKSFAENLLNTILNLLPSLKDVNAVSYVGLNGLFSLLSWCQSLDREKVFTTVLRELHSLARKIGEVRQPEYNILKTQYNVSSLVFERELCSDSSLVLRQSKKKGKDDQDKRKGVEPLKSKFLTYYSNDIDEYLVDLDQKCKVREIRLAFDQNNKQIKFRVQIWAIDHDGSVKKELIHSKFYSESTWIQLTNYAYDRTNNENNYKPTEELECLGFSNLNVTTRYLLIQITYAVIPFVQSLAEKNDKKIIPEVYGEPLKDQSGEIPQLQGLFGIKTITYKDAVKYPHTAKYERFDITGKASTYKYIFDSTGTLSKGSPAEEAALVEENEEILLDRLKTLQGELAVKLEASRNPENAPQNQDGVVELCEEIENTQLKLLEKQDKKDYPSLKQPAKSLDYLYTLAMRFSQALRRVESTAEEGQRLWRKDQALKTEQGRQICYDIFENLVAYEIGPINKEFIALLSEVLVNNLNENEWHLLVISIINNFLTKPINIMTSPVNSIFSHSRIIEALQKISVPTNELLTYLIKRLNIPLKLTGLKDPKPASSVPRTKQEEEEDRGLVCTLTTVLLLLNDGYKKLQSESDLAPPGMKRSVSTAVKEDVNVEAKPAPRGKEEPEVKRLSYEESLQAAFSICVWICENPALNPTDKTNLLTLCLDLVLQIIRFCKSTGIKDLLKNPNSFLKLFISTMRLGSSTILAKFQALLNTLLNPKVPLKNKQPQEQANEEEAYAEQTKILLMCHLQTVLKCLIDYVLQPDAASFYFTVMKEELPASIWLENVCFILDFLLSTAEKLNIDPNKETKDIKKKPYERKKSVMTEDVKPKEGEVDLLNLSSMRSHRSLSFSLELKPKEFRAEDFDKSTAVPLELVSQLILLLSPKEAGRPDFNFNNSTRAWSLVMKAILKVKVTILIESKIFESLIASFLAANDDIQQIMFPEIIELTQSMLKHQNYQKELCNALLQVIFNTLNSFTGDKYEPIAFSLLKGWLDILLTNNSPKPEDFYVKPPEKAFCKLNAQGAFTLFVNLSKYLWNHLNVGAKDGAQNCSELNIVKLQVANDLLRLLITSESTSNLMAVGELFSNFKKYSGEIKKALELYLHWFLLNRATDSSSSPSTDLMLSLSESLMKLFNIISDYQEVTKAAIAALIQGCKKIDQTLLKLLSAQQASAYTILQYNTRACKILEELFDIWVTSDAVASLVAFEVKGFEYLLDRMGITSQMSNSKLSSQASASSLLEGTDLLDHISRFKEDPKSDLSSKAASDAHANAGTDDPKEEEFANKLTIINQPGQAWSGITPDWSINKKGVKSRILFFVMSGNFYNEYCLVFNLEKTIELKQIKIGFNCVWGDYNDKVLGIPSSVLVEGGTSTTNFTPIATLEPINDEGYTNFSVKVFHKNFQTISKTAGKSLETSLESLSSKKISYLKFRFRRPIVTFVEGLSMLSTKNTKTVAVSISFISITGFDSQKLPNTKKKVVETQENSALQVISKLCNDQFTETLETMANEAEIVNKIKSSFDNLSRLLVSHESWLAPVFKAIASHNDKMGDWIMSKFLELSRSREHAKLVGEIVLANNSFAFERLQRFHQFVIAELKRISSLSKAEAMNKFSSLVPFIETLCTTVRSIPLDLQKQSGEPHLFEFRKEDIDVIVQAFETYNASTSNKMLIKLILLYLYLPAPFTTTEQGLIKYTLDRLWAAIHEHKKSLYYEMLGPIIIGSNFSAKWFTNHLDHVLIDLSEKLQDFNRSNFKALRHAFILLNNISRNEHIKRKIASSQWHLKLYQGLKSSDEKSKAVLKDIDLDILQLAVEFLKNVSAGYPQVEEELAQVFITDLQLLEKKRDLFFVNNLLVPLLNAESEIPVCIHPYDPQSKRTIIDTKHLPTLNNNVQVAEFIKSSILSKEQTEILQKTVQKVTNSSGLARKMKNIPWQLAFTSQNDSENLLPELRSKLSKQGPFLIIMEGLNSGKKCFVGVFCSQSMAELPEQFDTSFDQTYPIPMADDNFMFYYDDSYTLHFPIPSFPNQTDFAQVHSFYDGGGGISFYYNNSEKIFISFTPTQTSYVEISHDVKPIEDEAHQNYPPDLVSEFVFKTAEFWVLKPGAAGQQPQKDKKGKSNMLSNVLFPAWYNANSPLNYFRASPVYTVPASLTIEKLVEIVLNSDIPIISSLTREALDPKTTLTELYEFFSNNPSTNNIIDIEFDVIQLLERQNQKKDNQPTTSSLSAESLKYKPTMTLFEAFEKNGGVQKIIEIALKSLVNWKDKEKGKRWLTWLEELSTFSALPNFFGLFLKNKDCIELLFQILAGIPDEEKSSDQKTVKKWEEEELKAVKFSYQILADVFAVDTDIKIREFALSKNFFARILDRIFIISKEPKRKWVDELKPDEGSASEKDSPELKQKKGESEEDYKKKIIKKKGVGYASDNTGQNQRWNVNEYVESKKVRNEQLQQMIEILHNFINVKEWHPPKEVLNQICESALLTVLESAFRSASLLDMAKEAELNQSYLRLTRAIAHHRSLLPCLLDLDPHYVPSQKDSIYALMSHLKELAQIFINCLTAADKEATTPNQKLAQDIIDTFKLLDIAVQSSDTFEESDDDEILDILAQPLPVAYRTLLQSLRFDYVSMKDANTNRFKHHYTSYINNNTPPQQKMIRLAQELADLSNALPIEHTNSIFVRVDESRVDVMKALIMGSSGTPYGHGAYEFDIYFDDAYPNAPPKVNLTTTGSGKVRFNPNLYSCGKVCLSLLGTWRGNASENWDPKLSTILQVLVSIQAIIMSEEIYFNEPGFEGEAGTEEGERKNEAYSNIVRYCNIKYAMVDQIKNPPKGFETVIKRHFYLKKEEILEEVKKWVKYAEHREASYTGLVNDHNTNWCSEFKSSKTRYKDMIAEAIKELENELNKLQPPNAKDVKHKVVKKKEKKVAKVNINTGVANLEDVDVSDDKLEVVAHKEMNIEDENVKDRWSRYIGAMGLDAVTKQANASIFLSGLGALGIEITKNIVLSGVKRFTIHDSKKTSYRDLSGQFYLSEEDIGKNRAQASLNKVQQLNYYVKVDTALLDQNLPKEEAELDKLLKSYTLVILTETDHETQIAVDAYCRKNKIYFISTDAYGPFSRIFSDFGNEFMVIDKNGEEPQEVMLGQITNEEEGLVRLLAGHTHKFEDGDEVIINGVDGMELIDKSKVDKSKGETGTINGTRHKIRVINAASFRIGDTRGYTPYVGNGLAKQLKVPITVKFQSLEQSLNEKIPFDPNMTMHDFLKINHPFILHIAFETLDTFVKKHKRMPNSWNVPDSDEFVILANDIAQKVKDYDAGNDNRYEFILRRFSFTCQGVFAPLAAFLGGYVAQEAIKAITQKFMPTQQLFYTDCYEVIPELPEKKEELEEAIKKLGVKEANHRSDGLRLCVGEQLLQELAYANLFMVGSGAIGCELLKNYAMLGLGTGAAGKNGRKEDGRIILTDPDVIEVSNLNRQFLFREKHLRKPKSQTAAAAALQMNKELKGHVIARLDKVHEGTANIFTDKFFEDLTVVTNALDNVQARRYIDLRCVNAKTPLLESGTLGPKGHVQVIVPYKTESYSSQEDPKEEAEIPHCTLKMFPEETLHCVEWARDKFGKLFTQRPKGLAKVLEDPNFEQADSQEIKAIRESLVLLQKMPHTFDDCIKYARRKFQKYFVNDIRQLLYTYPLDAKTKEGRPFWSLPKRPPTELTFDPKNILHASFIAACACLRANVFNIPVPVDARKESGKFNIAEEAAKIKVADYQPSDEKAKAISSEVDKDASKQASSEENPEDDAKADDIDYLIKEIKKIATNLPKDKEGKIAGCKPEEFEKDNDQNFHIDFIYALANCRSSNYKLEPMEWMTVKIKAGRIIPALATTTAAVSGLQTIELCKLIKKCKIEDMKNAFLSLAVPIMALSEPGNAPPIKLTDKLTVSLWDRWEVKLPREATLKQLFEKLEQVYELEPRDVNYGSQTIYFHALMDIQGKEKEKEETLQTKLEELLNIEKEDKYADLSVMFTKKGESEILKGVPIVRVTFE